VGDRQLGPDSASVGSQCKDWGAEPVLDLLLLTVPKTRVIHQDGIRFQGLRFVDPTLAAYVGESVILRYDPRDVAEIRVFHNQRFLCRAICPELGGEPFHYETSLRPAINECVSSAQSCVAERRLLIRSLHSNAEMIQPSSGWGRF
jgi:hypothetical protein